MNFFEKIYNLPHTDFDITGCNDEQKQLYNAAKGFLCSDEKISEQILRNLHSSTQDEQIKKLTTDLLFPLLLWQDRFDELALFGIPRNSGDEKNLVMNDTKAMTSIYSPIPKELPMPPTVGDLPSVCVQINGVDVVLLIDTGAIPTVITESVAKKCGIDINGKTVETEAMHENFITTRIANIDNFKVGNNEFRNKSCIIIPDSALDTGNTELPPMNGAVGWEIIKNLLWTLNFRDRCVRIEMSKSEKKPANMCCDFFPMVNVMINERRLTVGLDTGAGATQFGKCMSGFFGETLPFNQEGFGAGGNVEISAEVIPHIDAHTSNEKFAISNALLYTNRDYSFSETFIQPGVLGSDIAKGKTLIIDYPNRNLTVSN
jgi:hypothetical protein